MRVLLIGHSYVADRQARFESELRRQLEAQGGELLSLFPAVWGRHVRRGGWFVEKPGDILNWRLPTDAWRTAERFGPTVCLIQNEAYHQVTADATTWCTTRRIPYVTFSWENGGIHETLVSRAQANFRLAAQNVFGNTDAKNLGIANGADPKTATILPQVGIDFDAFHPRPDDAAPEFDLGFFGRGNDPMKGKTDLMSAINGQGWTLLNGDGQGLSDYPDMPKDRYWRVRVTCVPSKDVPGFAREQFAPAVTIESLACGVPVVATNQSAIMEWGRGAPAIWFAEQGDIEDLRRHLREVLDGPGKYLGVEGRKWAEPRFSNPAVAAAYMRVLGAASS